MTWLLMNIKYNFSDFGLKIHCKLFLKIDFFTKINILLFLPKQKSYKASDSCSGINA